MREPVLTAQEVTAFVDQVFPQQAGVFQLTSVGPMVAEVRQDVHDQHLRPGGTVSGPTLFTLADCAFYLATLAMIGRVELAVTTNLNMTFMRKAPEAPLRAEARILKLGKLLAQGDVLIYSDAGADPVAHAAVTYAIPPR